MLLHLIAGGGNTQRDVIILIRRLGADFWWPGMERQDNRAEWYRRKAEEAMRAAEAAKDPAIKKHYEEIAQSWLDLAKRQEPDT